MSELRLLSVSSAARILGRSPRTVRRRIADRSLPAVLEGGQVMIRSDELDDYVRNLERVGDRPVRRRRTSRKDFGDVLGRGQV